MQQNNIRFHQPRLITIACCSLLLHLQIAGANFQLAYGSQSPVTALPASEAGFHDVFGNAWEWAEDHFAAFHGFKVHPYYEDFSAPCFGGLHHMVSDQHVITVF
jgi:formylglycine-generating enzyme required for sulfatase activity